MIEDIRNDNQIKLMIFSRETIHDTMMMLKMNSFQSLLMTINSIRNTSFPEGNSFPESAERVFNDLERLKPVEDYPELWI